MKTVVDPLLVAEAREASLRFECDDCAHFDARRARCAHGYPIAAHRPGPLVVGKTLVFCKEFELGAPRCNEESDTW
jgi:hypothetical protein